MIPFEFLVEGSESKECSRLRRSKSAVRSRTDDKAKPEVDELEKYLAMSLEDTDIVLLDWWKNHEYRFPKLAKMAKQYLAAPASTAGVERVFSAAGRMHNDLRTSR